MAKTTYPVTLPVLQGIMNKLGYFLGHLDGNAEIHWNKESGSTLFPDLANKLPRVVTTLQPDFDADGFKDKVYDRDYIVDLISHLCAPQKPFDHIQIIALLAENRAVN